MCRARYYLTLMSTENLRTCRLPVTCVCPAIYALPLSLLASIEDSVVGGGDGMGDDVLQIGLAAFTIRDSISHR